MWRPRAWRIPVRQASWLGWYRWIGAIDFDDEFECRAVEVDDESSDDVLTSEPEWTQSSLLDGVNGGPRSRRRSELEARELAFSYSAPELGLGWRGVASHLPGMFEFRSGSRPRP